MSMLANTGASGTVTARVPVQARRSGLLPPGWPLAGLLGFYPLWWAIGLGAFAFLLFALPMGWYLLQHRPIKTPPGFGLWLLFLLWVLVSMSMFPFSPPEATPGSTAGQIVGLGVNAAAYLASTVGLLYVVNLPTAAVAQERILRLMSILFIATVAGGVLGVAAPHFQFVAPLEHFVPFSIRRNPYTMALIHPQAAQVQDVLGTARPRPSAPFGYTNFWGNEFSILLVWWVVFMFYRRSLLRRTLGAALCAVAIVPVVYSLNRALWIGLGFSLVYAFIWSMRQRQRVSAMPLVFAVIAVGLMLALTPLHNLVSQRFSHGHSNSVRAYLAKESIAGAVHSPVIGYGGPRKVLSPQSIAVGPTAGCPRCGDKGIGSTGQFWLVLFSQGFVGAVLYVGFFVRVGWTYLRTNSIVQSAGVLVVFLSLFYMFFYNAIPGALMLTMISVGVLVREGIRSAQGSIEPEGIRDGHPPTVSYAG